MNPFCFSHFISSSPTNSSVSYVVRVGALTCRFFLGERVDPKMHKHTETELISKLVRDKRINIAMCAHGPVHFVSHACGTGSWWQKFFEEVLC